MKPAEFLSIIAAICVAMALFVGFGYALDAEFENQARAAQQWQRMADDLAARQ